MADTSKSITWPKLVLFGDSLTELSFSSDGRWGAILADRLQRKCDVLPRGFSGYNSSMCRALLPAAFPSFGEPIVGVTILLGANDANVKDKNPQQHVPLDEYEENLKWMVQFLRENEVEPSKVILITPPMYEAERWIKSRDIPESTKDNETVKLYAEACKRVADSQGCACVDFFHIMEQKPADDWKELLNDGLHFSPKGSQVLADALWPLIEERTKTLPRILPDWQDMLASNPSVSVAEWMAGNKQSS